MSWAYECHFELGPHNNATFPSEELFCDAEGLLNCFLTLYFQALEPFGLS